MSAFDALGSVVQSLRADSWVNFLTGMGTSRDKTTGTGHYADIRLADYELTSLFNYDDMAKKIVSIFPREMMRQGSTIGGTPEKAKRIKTRLEALNANSRLEEGMTWGRLYGGSGLFVGANDGQPADSPLQERYIRSVDFLDVYDRRRLYPYRYNEDPYDIAYGQPTIYQASSLKGGTSYIHASRLIIFRGALTDDETRSQLQGWDLSVLQVLYNTLAKFNEAFNAAGHMMTDASQAVFKLKGLIAMIAGGKKKDLETRALLLDTLRSVSRAIFLDADEGEEFSKIATQFAGVSDVLDRAVNRLAGASEIPVTILMGQAPAGLNATGASDVRIFYDLVKSMQVNYLTPRRARLIHLVALGEGYGDETFPVTDNELWQETRLEKATREKVIAERDHIYIQDEVYSPEECAIERSRDPDWMHLDLSLRTPLGTPTEPTRLVPPAPALPPGKLGVLP